MDHPRRLPMLFLLLLPLLLVVLHPVPAEKRTQSAIERVDVNLILVDVEARDAQGRPMRGLTAADFEVRLNGVRRTLYSVDDRCGCDGRTPTVSAHVTNQTPSTATETSRASPANSNVPVEPFHVILYFDFALMDQDGRTLAFNEARRWIRETMRDGDQVMIVGSTYAKGAVTVAEMTSDRVKLLAALDTMEPSPDFVDPHMAFLYARDNECKRDWTDPSPVKPLPNCNAHAFDEYNHTRSDLKTLTRFLESLDSIEGRKHLVLLHQVAIFRPSSFYPGAREQRTHQLTMEEVGSSALASHVVIHAASTGDTNQIASMAAEYTGGTHNLGRADLSRMLDDVRDRCECLYRLGIEPLDKERGRVGELTVRIRKRPMANLRVKAFTSADKWLRQARRVLRNPAGSRDLPVRVVLLPVAGSDKGWTAKVQVALHASALTRLPSAQGTNAEWEAGALLEMDGGEKNWEMLAVSSMKAASSATAPEWFVHEKTLVDLPPGTYRLSAFVRDRSVDLFGGASFELSLPDAAVFGVIGPIPLLAQRRMMTTDLPLQPVTRDKERRGVMHSAGLVPAGAAADGVEGGAPFEIMTWFCGVPVSPSPPAEVDRYIGDEDTVVMKFPATARWVKAGTCMKLTDRVDAGLLDDRPYRYHVRWKSPAANEPMVVEAELPLPGSAKDD